MKKTYVVVALAALSILALGACNENKTSIIPDGGTTISTADGVQAMKAAMATTTSWDAASVAIADGDFSFLLNYGTTYTNSTYGTSLSRAVNISAAKFDLNAAAEGLTSTTLADVKGAVTVGGDIVVSSTIVGDSLSGFDYSWLGLAASAYLTNGNIYVDASNSAAHQMLETVAGSTSLPDKFYGQGVLSAANLPLINASAATQVASWAETAAAYIGENSGYFTYRSYTDGRYSLELSLTKQQIIDFISKNLLTTFSSVESGISLPSSGDVASLVASYMSGVTVDSFDVGVVFSDNGLISFGTDIDVQVSWTGALTDYDSLGSVSTIGQETISASLISKFQANFAHGSDVTVTIPTDFSGYTAMDK